MKNVDRIKLIVATNVKLARQRVLLSQEQLAYNANSTGVGGGFVSLSGSLDRIAVTTSDTYNGGSINVAYQ